MSKEVLGRKSTGPLPAPTSTEASIGAGGWPPLRPGGRCGRIHQPRAARLPRERGGPGARSEALPCFPSDSFIEEALQ